MSVILLVDSFPPRRVLREGILYRARHVFFSAASAVEAERVFAKERGAVLVIINSRIDGGEGGEALGYSPNYHNDKNLDPLNGTWLASRLLMTRPDLRILFLVHRVPPEVVLKAFCPFGAVKKTPGVRLITRLVMGIKILFRFYLMRSRRAKALPEKPESEELIRAIQELLDQ